ncbi:MAG TPA: protein kinase [Sandaracinaceae bacterium LLY-WYZ-13_1]|nr:protein kinase [Sandaracinaceae bacterium LLY-WYZ-13_1]
MGTDVRRAWAQTLVGRTVAERYRLDELLDVGGMGAVFVGRHVEMDRPVAVKTVVPGALSDAQTQRLRREARLAAAVGGRGVVDVTDFGVDEVCGPYLVMELLSGETLGARLSYRGVLSVDEAGRIVDAVLATLARVHARGLVHRDLKPENLFLAREEGDEVVKILDFGIARPVRSSGDTLTAPGAVVGTPKFMAPEQARGEKDVDARADVYAVGAILYAMLSGRRPYDELDSGEALAAAIAGPPRPLREVAPHVGAALAGVVDRAMARDPADRYPDAAAMRRALRDARGIARSEHPVADDATVSAAPIDRGAPGSGPRTQLGEAPTVAAPSRDGAEPPRGRAWLPWTVAAAALVALAIGAFTWPAAPDGDEALPAADRPPAEGGPGEGDGAAGDEDTTGADEPTTDDAPGADDARTVVEAETPEAATGADDGRETSGADEPTERAAGAGEPTTRGASMAPAPRPSRARPTRRGVSREPREAPAENQPPEPTEPARPDGPGRSGSLSMDDF